MLKNYEGCGIEVKVIHGEEIVTLTVALAQLNFENEKLVWIDGKGHYIPITGSFYSGGMTGVGKDRYTDFKDIDEGVKILETNPIEALRKFEISKEERQARIKQIKANNKKKQEETI